MVFSVCMCENFQASPRKINLEATERILRYLNHILNVACPHEHPEDVLLQGHFDECRRFRCNPQLIEH
jgi:hypothetical protein